MLPGFSGRLISESFLEERLSLVRGESALAAHLRAWRSGCLQLGPAASMRSMLEVGALPLAQALGFVTTSSSSLLKCGLASSLRTNDTVLALLTAPWGEPLDAMWRPGIEHAARTNAGWCLFFNGVHLRIVDARRLYARRHADFDLDLALDDERSTAALATVLGAHAISSLRELIAASEQHSAGVCLSLRAGVFEASSCISRALGARRSPTDAREQSLTIVYRILFLLFAEARRLVPVWHPIYRDSYSVLSLCERANGSRSAVGLWDAIRAISRLAHAGCDVADLHVTAFNGRLFSPSRTPLAERKDLDDAAARRALMALSTRPSVDGAGRERIGYRDLGVEELGGVYESLLDDHAGAGERKATGTFYTPQVIAQCLVRRALGPLVADAAPERILALRVLDPAMGSGACLVAACYFLSQAYETSLVESGGYRSTDFGPHERVLIRRRIAERCLYGVDRNPMAVQLARLSLWLTTLASDRPLSFLDHRLMCGDSVIGTWLSCLRRAPHSHSRRQDSALPLFSDEGIPDVMRGALPSRFALADGPSDTVEQVRAKERALAALNSDETALAKWKRVADLWCAGWFVRDARLPSSVFGALTDVVLSGTGALPAGTAARHLEQAGAVAAAKRFFHWELEFPEVFFDADGTRAVDGGFDAVLGNPPWDMVRGDAGVHSGRDASRDEASALVRFTRDSGVYESQSDGHANLYQLFMERAMQLARPGGRIGMVLPSGFMADHGSARLRQRLFSSCAVDEVTGFDNSSRVFPIHRSVRFHLLTATAGRVTTAFDCELGLKDPRALDSETHARLRVTPDLLRKLGGSGMPLPDFRSTADVAIAERSASLFQPLAAGWNARFGRELNATDDRKHFRPHTDGFPVIEGKALEPFRVSLSSENEVAPATAAALLGDRCSRWRLGYRDVASATNRTTLIAALLPPGTVSTHTVFCLRTPLPRRSQYFLCGLFNSFVVNYLVRLRVTTHVTTAIVEGLPIPTAVQCPGALEEIAVAARALSRHWNADTFAAMNARVAAMYQLSRDEFAHVLDSFPLVAKEERDRAYALSQLRG
ncbi:MAG TPA: N-6 DNA methylase [Vicinamibacterales bacterium]|nr:N-6 DNA methylase [Vicinamibacterales bacterium]